MIILEFLEIYASLIIISKGTASLHLEAGDVPLWVTLMEKKGQDYVTLIIMNF